MANTLNTETEAVFSTSKKTQEDFSTDTDKTFTKEGRSISRSYGKHSKHETEAVFSTSQKIRRFQYIY